MSRQPQVGIWAHIQIVAATGTDYTFGISE